MSGSSSSGGGGGGFGSPDPGTNCQQLRFVATVQSPQPDAVAALAVGDVLNVVLVAGTGTTPSVIEVQRADGTTVGALIDHVTELLRCLQDGFQFVAEVLEISGGAVRVRVRAQ